MPVIRPGLSRPICSAVPGSRFWLRSIHQSPSLTFKPLCSESRILPVYAGGYGWDAVGLCRPSVIAEKGMSQVSLSFTQSPLPMCDLDFTDSEGVYLRHLTEALI
jgi:hypothetical protein